MIREKLFLSCLALLLTVSVSMVFIPSAYSARPVIYSKFTSTPPMIDGVFTQGDPWSANLQITMLEPEYPITAYVYILNDKDYLYFLVDAAGDTTDGASDECLLVFNFNPPYIRVQVTGQGGDHTIGLPYDGVIGYDSSPNNANSHKIYEFKIPWGYIGISAGQPIDFSSPPWKSVSMPYDADSTRDNVWPKNLVVDDIETWPILYTSTSGPVGGYLESSNKLSIVAPYLALFGAIAAVAVVVILKKPEN
jgi:hypothetical protein